MVGKTGDDAAADGDAATEGEEEDEEAPGRSDPHAVAIRAIAATAAGITVPSMAKRRFMMRNMDDRGNRPAAPR
jgi:hypothetical protein